MFLKELPNVKTETNSLPLVALSHTPVEFRKNCEIAGMRDCGIVFASTSGEPG